MKRSISKDHISHNDVYNIEMRANEEQPYSPQPYPQSPQPRSPRRGISRCLQVTLILSSIFANGIAAASVFYIWKYCGK